MEIAAIILSSLSILLLGVILFVVIKNKPKEINSTISDKEIGALQEQIKSLK